MGFSYEKQKNTEGFIIPILKYGVEFTDVEPAEIQQIINSVDRQGRELDAKANKEYVNLSSDLIQEEDKNKLEDFITSLYE